MERDIGPLHLWVRREGDEWHVASEREPSDVVSPGESGSAAAASRSSEGQDWRRWVVGDQTSMLLLKPAMPDRPVVVRPEHPVRLPSMQRATFYVSIPIWVQVTVGDGRVVLCEEPTLLLSNIWFGDYAAGELCYSLKTRARRNVDAQGDRPARVLCPVNVMNSSKTELNFLRLCIRVGHLRILNRNDRLWTPHVNVTFRGEDEASRIDYGTGTPEQTAQDVGTLLAEPRSPLESSILQRSFRNLRIFNVG